MSLRDGKIVRSEEPLNLETPFETLDGFITPTKLFYVRTHFPVPRIDKNKWRLRIDGEVEKPLEINYDELTKLESKKVPVTLECAGNNRSFLEPNLAQLATLNGLAFHCRSCSIVLELNRAHAK